MKIAEGDEWKYFPPTLAFVPKKDERETHRSAGFVVVQIHLLAQISTTLSGVDEFTGELEPVADVVRASTPFPVTRGGRCPRLMRVVAGARLDAALAARSRDAVRHRRARDGVDEGGLSTACKPCDNSVKHSESFLPFVSFR